MTDAATLAANKTRARDYVKACATQDRAWLEANVARTCKRQDTTLPFEVVGPEGVLKLGDVLLGAFSDVDLDIQRVVAEGDMVLVHLRFRDVHLGALRRISRLGAPFRRDGARPVPHGGWQDRRTMAGDRQPGPASADRAGLSAHVPAGPCRGPDPAPTKGLP